MEPGEAMKLIRQRYRTVNTAANVPSDDPALAAACAELEAEVSSLLEDQILDAESRSYGSFGIVNGELREKKRAQGMRFDHPWDRCTGIMHTDIRQNSRFYARILTLARAYSLNGCRYKGDPEVLAAINAACQFGEQFIQPGGDRPGNWWAWDIGTPLNLTQALLLVGEEIVPDMREKLIRDLYDLGTNPQILGYNREYGGGQNVVWVAQNGFRLGLLAEDARLVAWGSSTLGRASFIVRGKWAQGIQPDGSYHYHGAGVNMAYGTRQLADISEFAYLTQDTPYQVPDENLQAHIGFFRDFAVWNAYRGCPLANSLGRSISREGYEKRYREVSITAALYMLAAGVGEVHDTALALLADAGRKGRDGFSAVAVTLAASAGIDLDHIGAEPLAGVRYWPCSEYLITRGKDYCASVRMASERRSNWFTIAGEHLKGWYTGEGAVEVQTDAREVRSTLMPTWPWEELTGVTRVIGFRPRRDREGTIRPKGWGGGCSGDGMGKFASGAWLESGIGCCGISYLLAEGQRCLRADKDYFAFGNILLLDGRNITARGTDQPCVTTLLTLPENADAGSHVVGGAVIKNRDGELELEGRPFHYRNVGLVPLDGTPCTLVISTREGRYEDIRKAARDNRLYRNRYFTVSTDHGTNPGDGAYSAAIILAATQDEVAELAADFPIERAAGNEGAIAWRTKSNNAGQVIFHEPSETAAGSLNVSGALAWSIEDGVVEIAASTWDAGVAELTLPFGVAAVRTASGEAVAGGPTRTIRFESDGATVSRFFATVVD